MIGLEENNKFGYGIATIPNDMFLAVFAKNTNITGNPRSGTLFARDYSRDKFEEVQRIDGVLKSGGAVLIAAEYALLFHSRARYSDRCLERRRVCSRDFDGNLFFPCNTGPLRSRATHDTQRAMS